MAVRILIVDDSAIFRASLRMMLDFHAGWEVCGEAVDGNEAVQFNRLLSPDLIIMDLSMPHMTGIEAARETLRDSPKLPIVLLTLDLTTQLAQEARNIGVRATLSKTAMQHLAGGIDAALRGEDFSTPIG
ncbi:MAG: response regulator transcription factor [Gammaproteobacteria bacterium]